MHAQDDLLLIREQLQRLTEMTYFDNALRQYASDVVRLIDYLVERIDHAPAQIVGRVHHDIWVAYQHLSGSISRETPYEVVFALTRALRDWDGSSVVLTTALIDEPNFFFKSSINWDQLEQLFPDFQQPARRLTLVQISLPRIYKTKPLYCIPLYHELAHHLDEAYKIVESAFLSTGLAAGLKAGSDPYKLTLRYMRETFADLFSACYCGRACMEGLNGLACIDGANPTHPPHRDRYDVVDSFLKGENLQIVNDLNAVLRQRGLPDLKPRFRSVDLAPAFDDMRPHGIETTEDLHGIFPSGWNYLEKALKRQDAPWSDMKREDVSRTVNDLVEKSIRNLDVRDRWKRAVLGQGQGS